MISSSFELNEIRIEIFFNSFEDLRSKLLFYQKHNLYKLNIPCKSNLKKEFLLSSLKIAREEFPLIDIIPHFSILHQFRRNKINTQNDFIEFLTITKNIGCKEILLVSGSKKRSTLDSISALSNLDKTVFSKKSFRIGIAFNSYLPNPFFDEELLRLKDKLNTGFVTSIWLQFGTNYKLLDKRINLIKKIISENKKRKTLSPNIFLYGSILIPTKQFLASFKYRPWKGVFCSSNFLDSVEFAFENIRQLLIIYKKHNIYPIIETNTSTDKQLYNLKRIIEG